MIDVAEQLGRELRRLPKPCAAVGESLLDAFDVRSGGGDWNDRFSFLTLHYPVLQASVVSVDSRSLKTAATGHLLLLIHAFLEDRLLDRQIPHGRYEQMFVKHMFVRGLQLVESIDLSPQEFRPLRDQILSDYVHAQCTNYDAAGPVWEQRVRRVAAGRAGLGALATVAVLSNSNDPGRTLRIAKNAFDALVTALQWADDMEDWREDFRIGDENLALLQLRRIGIDVSAEPIDEPQIGNLLVKHGVFEYCAGRALWWLERAKARQTALGCSPLVEKIEALSEDVRKAPGRLRRAIEINRLERFVDAVLQPQGKPSE